MAREEEILSEAKKYYSDNIRCYNAFLHGVEFAEERPKNVWHDAKGFPAEDRAILFRTIFGIYSTINYRMSSEDIWKVYVKDCGVMNWVYINDLLPKGGEE